MFCKHVAAYPCEYQQKYFFFLNLKINFELLLNIYLFGFIFERVCERRSESQIDEFKGFVFIYDCNTKSIYHRIVLDGIKK